MGSKSHLEFRHFWEFFQNIFVFVLYLICVFGQGANSEYIQYLYSVSSLHMNTIDIGIWISNMFLLTCPVQHAAETPIDMHLNSWRI